MYILFRHTFPKQPSTRPFSIILWMPNPEKYAVHMEFDDPRAGRVGGDYFSADQFGGDFGEAFTKALTRYQFRCQAELDRYGNLDFWDRVLEELHAMP